MGFKSFTVCAFAATAAMMARAAPQRVGIMPVFKNETIPATPTITAPPPKPTDSKCVAECVVRYPELRAVSWVPADQITYNEEVTIGTISIVTMVNGNLTETQTRTGIGNVPTEYNLWRPTFTDEAGTAFISMSFSKSDGGYSWTRITYPTPYMDYPSAYHWEGVLPTSDPKVSTAVCSTATELAYGDLSQHPEYFQPKTATPDKTDPFGAKHTPIWVAAQDIPDKSWFDAAFPSESAFASCESVPGKPPGTEYYAPKFVYDTTSLVSTVTTQPIHVETSTDGFENTSTVFPSKSKPGFTHNIPPPQPTATGFENTSTSPPQLPEKPTVAINPPVVRPPAVTSNVPIVQPPAVTGNVPIVRPPADNNNPPLNPQQPGITAPPLLPVAPTPILIFIPTTINNLPTASPAYIIPDTFSTASIGQTVVLNNQPTVLTAPPILFADVPTTINGIATSTPAYIISGTSTATIGQTITLSPPSNQNNPQPQPAQPTTTVLAAPAALYTLLPTTIHGTPTTLPIYIISGTSTATLGQTVLINGIATVLSAPAPYLTILSTTIQGIPTAIPVYIISGTSTATPGQTITLNNGQPTVLPPAPAAAQEVQLTALSTTLQGGTRTVLPVYIIRGTSTALPGQTITLANGVVTVLPTASDDDEIKLTSLTTTLLGKQTVIPVYIISGSLTATVGQTVTLAGGRTTVLSPPSPTPTGSGTEVVVDTRFGGPASTAFSGARETGGAKGKSAAVRGRGGVGGLSGVLGGLGVVVIELVLGL